MKQRLKNNSAEKDRNFDVICKTKVERELGHRKECTAKTFIDAFLGSHSIEILTAGHVPTESCLNCKLLSPLRMNPNNKETKNGQEIHELPTINVHGSNSLQQPSAETTLIPPEVFPAIIFDGPEFLDAEFFAILSKAEEILKCIVEALQSNKQNKIRDMGPYFANYHDMLHRSNGKLFPDNRMAMLPQLRVPLMMRLHKMRLHS